MLGTWVKIWNLWKKTAGESQSSKISPLKIQRKTAWGQAPLLPLAPLRNLLPLFRQPFSIRVTNVPVARDPPFSWQTKPLASKRFRVLQVWSPSSEASQVDVEAAPFRPRRQCCQLKNFVGAQLAEGTAFRCVVNSGIHWMLGTSLVMTIRSTEIMTLELALWIWPLKRYRCSPAWRWWFNDQPSSIIWKLLPNIGNAPFHSHTIRLLNLVVSCRCICFWCRCRTELITVGNSGKTCPWHLQQGRTVSAKPS